MAANSPRVSIGMPVYNGEIYLAETLDSILAQTWTDFELVISDNASTDDTPLICERYAARDGRIRYFRNARNLGIAPNYNRVFELASGEYFKWADYDDLLEPQFLAETVAVLAGNPRIAVCFPRIRIIDENGALVRNYDPQPDTSSPEAHIRFRDLMLSDDHVLAQASGLIRSSFIWQTVLYGSYPCSDEVFLAHLALLGSFHELPQRLISIRHHPRQSTRGVLASERARVAFTDTSLADKVVLIKWLYLKDCLSAINSAPLTLRQRSWCRLYMLRWLMIPHNFRPLLKDALLAASQWLPMLPRLRQGALDAAGKPHHYQ